MFRQKNLTNNHSTKQFPQYGVFFEFSCYQNGNHGEHGADVLRLVEAVEEEEQDHAQMDRVALAWMKTQKRALWLNVPVRKQIATNIFTLSNTMYCWTSIVEATKLIMLYFGFMLTGIMIFLGSTIFWGNVCFLNHFNLPITCSGNLCGPPLWDLLIVTLMYLEKYFKPVFPWVFLILRDKWYGDRYFAKMSLKVSL